MQSNRDALEKLSASQTRSYLIWHERIASVCADRSADLAIKELNENYQQYKLIEQELQQRRARLLGKIPEIQKAVAAVDMLISKQEASQEVRSSVTPQHANAAVE